MANDGSDAANPFQSPVSDAQAYSSGVDPSMRTVEMLRQTRPWVRFLAILGVVGMVFLGLGAIFLLVAAITTAGVPNSPGLPEGAMAFVYGLLIVLYYFPVRFLFRYSGSIQRFVESQQTEFLDDALEAQKSFWKFCGVAMVIYLVFVVLMLLFGALGGVLAAV